MHLYVSLFICKLRYDMMVVVNYYYFVFRLYILQKIIHVILLKISQMSFNKPGIIYKRLQFHLHTNI